LRDSFHNAKKPHPLRDYLRGRIRLLFCFSSFIPNTPGITPGIMRQAEPFPVTRQISKKQGNIF